MGGKGREAADKKLVVNWRLIERLLGHIMLRKVNKLNCTERFN